MWIEGIGLSEDIEGVEYTLGIGDTVAGSGELAAADAIACGLLYQ